MSPPVEFFELPPLRKKKPLIPVTPVVAVETAVRLEAEHHFDLHDTDDSGFLDLYQMVSLSLCLSVSLSLSLSLRLSVCLALSLSLCL
eukprot:COSAG03_NODE_6010_length_1131_cov_1.512597_1_plen_87_part_10